MRLTFSSNMFAPAFSDCVATMCLCISEDAKREVLGSMTDEILEHAFFVIVGEFPVLLLTTIH
jgi:hypothetical protein